MYFFIYIRTVQPENFQVPLISVYDLGIYGLNITFINRRRSVDEIKTHFTIVIQLLCCKIFVSVEFADFLYFPKSYI